MTNYQLEAIVGAIVRIRTEIKRDIEHLEKKIDKMAFEPSDEEENNLIKEIMSEYGGED